MRLFKSKKGLTFAQVMAASIILSFSSLYIYRTVIMHIDNNMLTIERRELFNASEYLYTHLEGADKTTLFADVGNSIQMYDYSSCNSDPIQSTLAPLTVCQDIFAPDLFYDIASDQIEVYIYRHTQGNFQHMADSGNGYPQILQEYATDVFNTYAPEDYYYRDNNPIYGISIVCVYDGYTKVLIYNQVIA